MNKNEVAVKEAAIHLSEEMNSTKAMLLEDCMEQMFTLYERLPIKAVERAMASVRTALLVYTKPEHSQAKYHELDQRLSEIKARVEERLIEEARACEPAE